MERSSEKESSRRSWPWKRKSNDKTLVPQDLGPSPVPSKSFDNHQIWEYQQQDVLSHQRQLSPMKARSLQDRNRIAIDETRGQWLESEERAKVLSEKLSNALADITSKDNLVKQHVKVAEEAVSGWEKAEAEAVTLKAQLDVALHQKLASEDRVAHLDGALKECMKQLRQMREDNEQHMHDTLLKKTREFDKLRFDMEAKLADSSQCLAQSRSELLESRAEVAALGKALQERSRSIVEINEAKGKAETEIKVLQVRLETLEKENSQLKYEVHVLNKELDIRSQEREYERKAVDMASKQHLESVKKIAKLEEECNRLRLLVRKKLPGPAAIQRMRMEVEGVSKDQGDRRRRSMSRSGSQLDLSAATDGMQENGHDGRTHEAQMLAERVVAMDEEMKMLKEALAQRTAEAQSARFMCSKTSAHLSTVEEELKRAKQQNDASSKQSTNFNPEFIGRKGGSSLGKSDNRRESQNFELMDDFAEMERLAMSVTLTEPLSSVPTPKTLQDLEEALASKTRELESKFQDCRVADQMCQDLRLKLKDAEKQLNALRSHNASNESSVVNLQEELDLLSQCERGKSGRHSPAPAKGLSGYTLKDILVRAKTKENGKTTSEASSSEGMMNDEQVSISDAESKASTAHLELSVAVRKIVHAVEMLVQATGCDNNPSYKDMSNSATNEISLQLDWQNRELNSIMRNLAHASNTFLQGKSDFVDFVVELAAVLDYVLTLRPFGSSAWEKVESSRESVSKDLKFMREQCANFDAELDRLRSEKADIASQLEKAVEQLQFFRTEHQDGKPMMTHGVSQTQYGDDSPIAKCRKEEDTSEEEFLVLSSPNPALRAASGELTRLRDRVAELEKELQGERQRHQGVAAKLGDLQSPVLRADNVAVSGEMSPGSHGDLSGHSTSEEDEDDNSEKKINSISINRERQEREIQAAALAECQRTILALGKQLKSLGTVSQGQEEREISPNSTNSSTFIEKMTENMELLRWQTEAVPDVVENLSTNPASTYQLTTVGQREPGNQWVSPSPCRAQRSPSPAAARRLPSTNVTYSSTQNDSSFYSRGEGGHTTPRAPSPARSELNLPRPGSVPASPSRSPATTPWSLRSRTKEAQGDAQLEDVPVEKPRSSSTFSRFYSRTRSGSISGSIG